MTDIGQNRDFMKCPAFFDIMKSSDQSKGVPYPIHSKAITGPLTLLPAFDHLAQTPYTNLLDARRSERVFTDKPMSQAELAFMLWSAQGMQKYRSEDKVAILRPVPSGGSRHPFELYTVVKNVEGLKPGIYRYAPMEHIGEKKVAIEYLGVFEDYENRMSAALAGQKWAATAPVVLFISVIPYRSEWRYVQASHRVMLIDLGHIGQNIMLSAVALGLGSCCIAAYNQELCDEALGFDGQDEYTVYAVPVGTPK